MALLVMPTKISAFFLRAEPNPDPGIIVEGLDLSLFKGGLDPHDTLTFIAFRDISLVDTQHRDII
jgi:hypothetical protein